MIQNTSIPPMGGANKIRSSNYELARIICMLMIMILHADNLSLGIPSAEEIKLNTSSSFLRIFIEQLCLIGVNVYILISGWFGIKFSTSGVIKFLTQVLTYATGFFFLKHILHGSLDYAALKEYFTHTVFGLDYWFVPSYLLLYILSPMINNFVENAQQKIVKQVLYAYFIFVWLVVWIGKGEVFSYGYSAIWFVGLYLFARYSNRYKTFLYVNSDKTKNLILYILASLIASLLMCFIILFKGGSVDSIMLIGSYLNIFVFFASWQFFVYISKLKIVSSTINKIASCVFAIYLVHVHPSIINHYCKYYNDLYHNNKGLVLILLYIVSLMGMAIGIIAIEGIRQYFLNRLLYKTKKK